ncbi:MAG: uroporphyrinogen decarboxylase [Aliifodinibius sp.]|nr:uroporphyrinogen decarboxylase [Fodinibius sp.]NIV14848.1 uroporphyrinogen decarboxylase [Fodinibius sp.]NIY28727.1 uroporphyrinogen decarboxylase [Fodinibius sp.]
MKNDLLIRACQQQPIPRTPVWIMRQAGRYLPQYREVRSKADFLTMCKTPELVTEVTLQPVDIIGVDAAIIFSDILVIPEAMGMKLEFHEGRGPVFEEPLRTEDDFDKLAPGDIHEKLAYVFEALKLVRKELAGRVPLIGFAGAPWTLAAYMVEGQGSKNFTQIKTLMYASPKLLKKLLDQLSGAVSDFMVAQIEAGAQVVQLFDSWAGILTPEYFRMFSLPYIHKVVRRVKEQGMPIIVFARDANHSVEDIAEIGPDVVSVSWREDLAEIKDRVKGKVALQGNLDPCALFAPKERIRGEVMRVLEKAGHGSGHIFNLGHGILPQTPVDNAKAMVEFVKNESPKFHVS